MARGALVRHAVGVVRAALLTVPCLVLALTGCGDGGSGAATTTPGDDTQRAALDRAAAVEDAVRTWSDAATLAEAQAAAERARNLITGPHVSGAGDGDGDGDVEPVAVGLLPGDDGSPGLASTLTGACVQRDVLGGSWDDPPARWDEVLRRIETWAPGANRFPELPSHAQRVVGWASLTLAADDVAEAHEYAGHALGHARITTEALQEPDEQPCPGG